MRTLVCGRHRRGNPLLRRSDVVEAWTALGVAVLLFVGVPLVGVWAGRGAHDRAAATAAAQRADRHIVRAKVIGGTALPLPATEDGGESARRALVRWAESGARERTAVAHVPAGTRTGEMVDVWFDSRGRGVGAPPDAIAVWQHTVVVGACTAGGAAAVVLLAHGVARRIALRHRLLEWEREWARTGPDWTPGRT
ncbi:hypothetical protein [Streptomyces shenzhenensis]|uniref:Rv1733c family protein n=1 Tax=Streptomyces shenzhenensis TaxID=943815 RepID=UPI001604B02E|nr:hypothetical protein [Streptomyces shenzhenensis]